MHVYVHMYVLVGSIITEMQMKVSIKRTRITDQVGDCER